MTAVNLNNHQIWQDFAEIIGKIDLIALVNNHLKACKYKVIGYQDGDDFYEEIEFITPIDAKLISSSLGITSEELLGSRWMTLNFLLKATKYPHKNESIESEEIEEIGELTLIFDSEMKCIDENWLIYIHSLFVIAKKEKNVAPQLTGV